MKPICIKHFRPLLALLLLAAVAGGNGAWAQTFDIEASHDNSTNVTTFTITRSGTNLPQQTINFRTVNLSAYAGQHYTAVSDTYTFPEGITTKTVEVSESAAGTDAYKYQTGTNRFYRFEVLDVNGFELQHYDRSMTTGTQFSTDKVSQSVSNLVTITNNGNFSSGMSSNKYVDVSFAPPTGWVESTNSHSLLGYVLIDDSYDYAQKPAEVSTSTLINSTHASASYLKSIGYKIYATVCFNEKEKDDGYQYIQIVAGSASHSYDGFDTAGRVNYNHPANAVYTVCFEFADNSNSEGKVYFPHRGTTSSEFSNSHGKLWQQKYKSSSYNGNGSVVLDPDVANITTRFDAGGNNDDTWGYKDFFVRMALCDATKPTLLNNPTASITVSAGPYIKGNTFYVSVPFKEIVTVTGTPTLTNNWGTLSYVSGSGSNVLTFSGTITNNIGSTLTVSGLGGTVKDLAGNSFTWPSNTTKTFTGVVSSSTYTLDNYNTVFTGLANEYVLSDNGPIEPVPTTVYFYKGTKTTAHRTTLTRNTHYTLAWANNNTAGNGTVTATGVAPYTGSASATFPIRWSTYTVRFHQNDGPYGTHATEDQAFTYATAQHLSSTLAREGYTVARWTTEPDGTGTSYGATQEVINLIAEDGAVVDLYAQWAVIPWTGTGDNADDPYIILYASQLDSLAATVNSGTTYQYKFFQLGADITYPHTTNWNDATSTENNYTAIGISGHEFYGTFDGDGKTVSGIRIYRPNDECQGLFGKVYSPTVKNIILANSIIVGASHVGGIAGNKIYGTMTNCRVESDVTIGAENSFHGGIAGYVTSGTVSGCVSVASVNGNIYCGGIVGCCSSTTIKDCLFTGTITSVGSRTGSITGYNNGSNTLTNNYYTNIDLGDVNGSDCDGARRARTVVLNEHVALVGEVTTYGVSGLTAIGTGNYALRSGGNIYSGETQNLTLTYSDVPATGYVWNGFIATAGSLTGNTLVISADNVTVSAASNDVWGVTNTPAADGSEAHPYLIADTTGLNLLARCVNGTDGYAANGFSGKYFKLANNITYSHEGLGTTESNYTAIGGYFDDWKLFSGTFDGDNDTISGIRIYKGGNTNADSYQGLLGLVGGGTIRNVTLTDAVITGKQDVGGIAGFVLENGVAGGIVENCHVTSSVTLHAVADDAFRHGGIAGDVIGGSVSGCTSAATLSIADGLTGCDYYGGIVGKNNSGKIENCLAVGVTVSGNSIVGAIIGNDCDGTDTANYYRNCTVNGTANATGVGLGGEPGNDAPHDIDGARSLHTLSLGAGVSATGASETKVIGETTYYASASTVTLNYTGTPAVGYTFDGISVDAGTLSGSTLTFDPAADITVSATFIDHWGVADSADGSAGHPYVITTTAGLDLLATLVNGGNNFSSTYFKLGADIAYSTTGLVTSENNYTAIGINSNIYFSGTFDGQGHTVSGIRIFGNHGYRGLFGCVYGGTVKNVTISDSHITGCQYVGGIVGENYHGTVENCHATATVVIFSHTRPNLSSDCHGGIVGRNNGINSTATVAGCTSAATVSGSGSSYGGIVGYLNGSLQNCLVLGATVNGTSAVGAVVGDNSGSVTNCHHRRCTVNGSAHNDLYAVVAGTDITLAPAGDATATYPYGGLQLYGSAILYGDTLYALQDSTVGLTLAYTGSSAHCFGFEATYGNDSYDILATSNNATPPSYLLTLPGSDVVVEALTCEHNYPVTVTAGSGTKMYDGTPLTKTAHEDFTVEGLPAGLTWTATADGTVTYVAPSPIGDEDKAENAVTDFHIFQNNVDVTSCFSSNNNIILVDGTLEVTKRPVTITACTAYKPYDGTSLTCNSCTHTGLAADDQALIMAAGRQIEIGSSVNRVQQAFIYNDDGNVTSNYEITKVDGTLTVTPRVDISAGSWQVVSTPMHDDGQPYWTFVDALTTNPSAGGFAYDLFRYDEPTATWENYKSGGFDHMDLARGYLYRSNFAFAIHYDGKFNNESSYSILLTATPSAGEPAGDLRGFNFVGNPYPYRVLLDRAFYSLNANGSWTAHPNGDSLEVGQGVLVYTTTNNEVLTFYASTRSTNAGAKGALPRLPKDLCFGDDCDDATRYPLPATGFAVLDGDQLIIIGEGTLQVYDVMGRMLFTQELPTSDFRLPTSDFPHAGVYILRLNGQSQKIVIK